MELAESLRQSLASFAILEDDAWEVRAWIEETDSIGALEAFYEIVGESKLYIAQVLHLVEERLKELDGS